MRFPSPHRLAIAVGVIFYVLLPSTALADPPPGFLETWPGTSTQNWGGGSSVTNPGSGGVGGAADGFLLVATPSVGNLGTRSNGAPYIGDWQAAGITFVRFSLNDVGANELLEIHFSIGNGSNLWQSIEGFSPPENEWGEFTINLEAGNFVRIVGTGTFDQALQNADRIHFRHDFPPFAQAPDPIQGNFGIDGLFLGDSETPALSRTWGRIKTLYR